MLGFFPTLNALFGIDWWLVGEHLLLFENSMGQPAVHAQVAFVVISLGLHWQLKSFLVL